MLTVYLTRVKQLKGALVLPALLFGAVAHSQEKTNDIDKIFNWANAATPGCACAVSQNGKTIVSRAYGAADLERNAALSPASVFDAGSLSKQFVAAAALLLAEEGRLSLSDDIRRYIPELPDYGSSITIDNLLTHTSGIRDWTGMLPLSSNTTDAFTLITRQRGLNFKPGEEWSYSNSGFVIMKEIIVRVAKMPFGDFVQQRLFEPLGMKQTSYRTDLRALIGNRAMAYDKDGAGRWKMSMMLDDDRGGGALFTTAADLIAWNEAIINQRLGKFTSEKLLEPTVLNNGRKLNYGRGLIIDSYRGAKEIWHSGSADGYKSWLGHYPEHGLSIAIMCNSGDGTDRTAFAHRIFDLLLPEAAQANDHPRIPPPADTAGMNMQDKLGLYFNERTREPLQLVLDRGRLRIAGGPGLVPVGKDRLRRFGASAEFMSADVFELQFLPGGQLQMVSMEGKVTPYYRARAYAPAAAGLQAFAGRYESDEIGTAFIIKAAQDKLVLMLEQTPDRKLELTPVDTDAFQVARMYLRFRRDKKGNVTGLDYTNPLLRNVYFGRNGAQAARN